MRVKDADWSLDNADGFVVCAHGEETFLALGQDGNKLKPEVLRMQLSAETVRQAVLRASDDFEVVSRRSQVAHYLTSLIIREGSANDFNKYRVVFIVLHSYDSLGRVPIDKLDAKDLRRWEQGSDAHIELRNNGIG